MYFKTSLMGKRSYVAKVIFLTFLLFTNLIISISAQSVGVDTPDGTESIPVVVNNRTVEEQIIQLSTHKWNWIVKRQTDSLDILFHNDLISIAPGVRMDKAGYIDIIKNGISNYNEVSILESEVQLIDDVSILYTKVVFGQVERKIFMNVTEVYKSHKNSWTLLRLQVQPTG